MVAHEGWNTIAATGVPVIDKGTYWVVAQTDNVNTVSTNLSIPNKSSASATFIIYGRIPAGQDVSAGTYRDTVGVTLIY